MSEKGKSWAERVALIQKIPAITRVTGIKQPYRQLMNMAPPERMKQLRRFWKNVESPDSNGCWRWRGRKDKRGAGTIGFVGMRGVPAHRIAYELTYGPIPQGLVLHHTCGIPDCCNPDHLIPMTRGEHASAHSRKRKKLES